MIKFSHIGQLHNVVRIVNERRAAGRDIERVRYQGTVKLHGSNASVVCTPAALQPQSRNRELSLDEDNLGFAAFALEARRVEAIRALEAELRAQLGLGAERPLALFGEWIGPGVQKGVAVSQLPARQWVLFALATLDDEGTEAEDTEAEDAGLRKRWLPLPSLGDRYVEEQIHAIVDGPCWTLELDFEQRLALEVAADKVEAATAEIDARCPWAARFGVEGVGEGLVWSPLDEHFGDSELRFKSKGARHQIVNRSGDKRKAAAVDPAVLESVQAFIAFAVTPARLAQGLEVLAEQGKAQELRSLGDYLRWLANDVRRECADDLESNGLEWKQVAKQVNEQAKRYFCEGL